MTNQAYGQAYCQVYGQEYDHLYDQANSQINHDKQSISIESNKPQAQTEIKDLEFHSWSKKWAFFSFFV